LTKFWPTTILSRGWWPCIDGKRMADPVFKIVKPDTHSHARVGQLRTAHGTIDTPVFMPIGTAGAVKGVLPEQLEAMGTKIILANTYHFMIRPGVDVIEELGGLHRFMAWNHPILTDSGGYQVFSLSSLNRVDNQGVEFASHLDGRRFMLTPHIATEIQNRLGADIIMCFDQCTHFPAEPHELDSAVQRTIRWARQCRAAHANSRQLLFGIVQGGIDLSLRTQCAQQLVDLDFPGYAIGGLSVGEGHDHMIRTVAHTARLLPELKPRYLMGVGTPADLIACICAGIDMFDCVLPTRNGRNAYAFTEQGPVRMRNSIHADSNVPVEAGCPCPCCRSYTRAAVRHFFKYGEIQGPILLSLHNLTFYQRLLQRIREAIGAGDFASWAEEQLPRYRELYGA